jgi:hypothetical protein
VAGVDNAPVVSALLPANDEKRSWVFLAFMLSPILPVYSTKCVPGLYAHLVLRGYAAITGLDGASNIYPGSPLLLMHVSILFLQCC